MQSYKKNIIILLISLFVYCELAYAQPYELNIKVNALRSNKGTCVIMLFQKGESFHPKKNSYKVAKVEIDNGQCLYAFNGLLEGEYAVIVFHDENNNEELDTNFWGMPKEGIGNSNNYNGRPNFEKSKFNLPANKNISITIQYL